MGICRRKMLLVVIVVVGTMARFDAAALAIGQPVGRVIALIGSATVNSEGTDMPAALNAAVREGDTVRTGPQSRIKLSLIDGSTLSLGADSTIKLDHVQMKSGTGLLSTTLSLVGGYVRATVARVKGDAQFQVESPSMVAAVRGTDWIEQFDQGVTQIFVAQGKVRVSGTGKYVGDRITLRAGEGVSFSDTAAHIPVTRWKKPKIDLFVAATRVP
jgi:hypothetical protein